VVSVPNPLAADGTVINHPAERTLTGSSPKPAAMRRCCGGRVTGALVEAEQSGRYGAPLVWAHGPGRREIARGLPAGDGTLRFTFERGDPVYRELVITPGLSATVCGRPRDQPHPGCQVHTPQPTMINSPRWPCLRMSEIRGRPRPD
jgi:hypothetical protein